MSFGGGSGTSFPPETTVLRNPITFFRNRAGVYPNNVEVWWYYKRPAELGSDEAPKYYLDVFDPAIRHQTYFGSSPAPKGHFILDAFRQDRSAAAGTGGIPVTTSGGHRPGCVAFYAGRVFYSGVHSTEYNTKVYFSQILEARRQAGYCYQQLDPTSEEQRDILPTDGGVILIPEASKVVFMKAVGQSLFVFATNGVWEITGSQGIGFTAVDYSVSKVSNTPCLSPHSFVDVEGLPLWVNNSGIHSVTTTEQGGYTVQSLTDQTIKRFFLQIPEGNRQFMKGSYDDVARKVRFIYRSTVAVEPTDQFTYDRGLVLDVRSGSWSPMSFQGTDDVSVKGVASIGGRSTIQTDELVFIEGEVVTILGEPVTIPVSLPLDVPTSSKYTVHVHDGVGEGLTFADQRDEGYRDWRSLDGVGHEVPSYFTSGYGIFGGGTKDFQSNYLTMNFESIQGGGAYVFGKWDYSTSGDTGKWNQKQQLYTYRANYGHLSKKLKFRGRGKTLQVQVENDGDKPFVINGWFILVTSNQAV